MQIRGEWFLSDDGIVRPVIRGEIHRGDGSWVQAPFLVDTAADRTVFGALVLAAPGRTLVPCGERLGGLGGVTAR
jgi:hypothetical protein